MSEVKTSREKNPDKIITNPFTARFNAPKRVDFDKYYLDVSEKEVFKDTGQVDPDTGDKIGVIEKKYIIKKIDIQEYLASQADSVGVASYMKALALQGTPIEDFHTEIDVNNIQDFSNMPDTLAEVMTAGDRAKEAFNNMDPELRGSHTTIEGFLNSLTRDTMDNYIKGKIDKLMPQKVEKEGE